VRLTRKLGYGGYPKLKSVLLEDCPESTAKLYQGINEVDDCDEVARKVFRASIQALEDTLNILDKEKYKRAVEALCSSRKLVFLGVGDAAAVARSGYQKFLRIGYDVHASSDIDVDLIAVSHMSKGDVVLAISHSEKSRSVVDVVKLARSVGVTVISITNYPVSPLAKNSDILLLTAAFSEHSKGEIMSKRIAELCILESLFINVLMKCRDTLALQLERSNQALEINKL